MKRREFLKGLVAGFCAGMTPVGRQVATLAAAPDAASNVILMHPDQFDTFQADLLLGCKVEVAGEVVQDWDHPYRGPFS